MSPNPLLYQSNLKFLIHNLKAIPHLFQRLGRDGAYSEFSLALREAEPQLPPGRMPRSLAKEPGHFQAAIAGCQGCPGKYRTGRPFSFFFGGGFPPR